MQVLEIERRFKYNSVTLPDPNPALGPDQIREFYATQYPELNNAVVEGPTTKDGVATYTLARAAGAKGASPQAASAAEVLRRTLAGPAANEPDALLVSALAGKYQKPANLIAFVAMDKNTAPSMPLPSRAFGVWG
jgi:PRTRC genetic system protein C